MQSDFYDAHNRHWQDAELLFEKQRWANADHLFGMAAECGLKELMLKFGMPFDSDRGTPQDWLDKKHADGIWTRYETYRSSHLQGIGYSLPSTNPFEDWCASQRYANQSNFNQARVEPHRAAAKWVQALIKKAQKEGLLSGRAHINLH